MVIKRRFWTLVGLALCAATVAPEPARAVVGASEDGSRFAPHVVMILNHLGATAGFCSAVVVAQDIVMTAAHCVPRGADLRVHYPDVGEAPVMRPVIGVARHPDYRPDAIKTRELSIDLALVHLASPLPERFMPAAFGTLSRAPLGARFTLAGFGVAREGEAATSGRLRSAALLVRAPLSSVLLWGEDPAKAGTGACTGDSGGPVVAENKEAVEAVVLWSAGAGAKQCGSLTQALWLAPHRAWIDRVMQEWARAAQSLR